MLQALVLDVPADYNFVRNNVVAGNLVPENMDSLLVQSFASFLAEGSIETYLWDLTEYLPEIDDFENEEDFYNQPLVKLSESIDDVQEDSLDGGRTHFYVVNPSSEEAGKRLMIRAMALAFWAYLRIYVFQNEYEITANLKGTELSWANHLDDDQFDIFINEDLDIDWLLTVMTDDCWHYDDAYRVETMDDLVDLPR